MVKHTPGPWEVNADDEWQILCTLNSIQGQYKDIVACSYGARGKANAKLIAAAPEMLEALTSIVSAWESPTYGDNEALTDHIGETIEQAREAIKKASS